MSICETFGLNHHLHPPKNDAGKDKYWKNPNLQYKQYKSCVNNFILVRWDPKYLANDYKGFNEVRPFFVVT